MTKGEYILMEWKRDSFQILTDIFTHSAYVLNFVDSNNILVGSCSSTLSQTVCLRIICLMVLRKTVNHHVCRMGMVLPVLIYLKDNKAYSVHGIGNERCEIENFNVCKFCLSFYEFPSKTYKEETLSQ